MLAGTRSEYFYYFGRTKEAQREENKILNKKDDSIPDQIKTAASLNLNRTVTLDQDLSTWTILRCKRSDQKFFPKTEEVYAVVTYPKGSQVSSGAPRTVEGSFSRLDIEPKLREKYKSCQGIFGGNQNLRLGHEEETFVLQKVGVSFI